MCWVVLLFIAGCSDAADPLRVAEVSPSYSVSSIHPTSAALQVGETLQLEMRDPNGNVAKARWSSSDPGVATVTSNGLVHGEEEGTATITGLWRNQSATSVITVSRPGGGAPPPPAPPAVRPGFYVAPNAGAGGDGSWERPWSFETALDHPSAVQPGDTIWMRGGTYVGDYRSRLRGTPAAPVVVRQYPGERATIDGAIRTSGSWTVFWGFEIMQSNPQSMDKQAINARGPGHRFVNLVIHDAGSSGIGFWMEAADSEVYGSILYNNGIEENLDHGIYVKNSTGFKRIEDNVFFTNLAYGIHVYTNSSGYIRNIHMDGNVAFNNGTISNDVPSKPNMLVGGETPAERITVANTMTYMSPGLSGDNIRLGYGDVVNDELVFRNNYVAGGSKSVRFLRWGRAEVRNNEFIGTSDMVELRDANVSGFNWHGNLYRRSASATAWRYAGDRYTFSNWRAATGLGSTDHTGSVPSGAKVVVRPNRYEPGRANIIVYNWGGHASVHANVSNVLQPGDRYEVRNVQNFYGTPVASGTYHGGTISLPMTGVAPPRPIGRSTPTPPRTAPYFDVFVVLRSEG